MLLGLLVVRLGNGYGDTPRFVVDNDPARTLMSFLALTKYPPLLLFLLLTLGVGALLLAGFERLGEGRIATALAVFGGAPMVFYLFHLTVLRLLTTPPKRSGDQRKARCSAWTTMAGCWRGTWR
ncbi:hypothetical protein [Xanthomonas floridensis]|uniref:DUF1624 domain-containing protein n=1 Tax=Xanthomonas floridensis TaxID=1843580 RepID=A0ABU5Q3N3_9XANT|nr:hypothetical protein [Xanthomonas floridensis]MEA5126084.1 hypothetical protein [Xanthomonas floridensis]MEA5133972.1 hypothetical protein [Xanthomonas floridensis]